MLIQSPERITMSKAGVDSSIDMISNEIHIKGEKGVTVKSRVDSYKAAVLPVRPPSYTTSIAEMQRLLAAIPAVVAPMALMGSGAMGSAEAPIEESEAPADEKYKVTVAGVPISGVYNLNNRNYAGLREIVYALENTNEDKDKDLPETARRVVWDNEARVATVRVTHRDTGRLAEKVYNAVEAGEENGFLIVNDRIMIGVRELAALAGLDGDHLEWHSTDGIQYVNLYEQKRVILKLVSSEQPRTYFGFVDDDRSYLRAANAETLLGDGYNLTEHEYVKGYFDVTEALKDRYEDRADFVIANFHTTQSNRYVNRTMQENGAVTVIAEVPVEQRTHPAQVVRAGEYGFIRIFAQMVWPLENENDETDTIILESDRQRLIDLIDSAVKSIGDYRNVDLLFPGVMSNVWCDGKDFHVNSQIVWKNSGSNAISEGQMYHVYSVNTGAGTPSTNGGTLIYTMDSVNSELIVLGSAWQNNLVCTVNLFTGSQHNEITIIHETFHCLGLEDAYAYDRSGNVTVEDAFGKEWKLIKPAASTNLVPDDCMMNSHSSGRNNYMLVKVPKITNVEMRMVFDANKNNSWTKFDEYNNVFERVSKADFEDWQKGRSPEEINSINRGLAKTTVNNRTMTSYSKQREYLMSYDRA